MVTCLAALVAFALSFTLAALIVAVPVVLMQKRFLMRSQLVAEARIDAKTGLLNAATWHRESETELSRAKGYWSPASAAIIDIDHFKAVNDTYGHLAGDGCCGAGRPVHRLSSVPTTGWGGSVARSSRSCCPVPPGPRPHGWPSGCAGTSPTRRSPSATAGTRASWSASPSPSVWPSWPARGRDLDDLLAAADAALYQAKDEGRNRIRAITAELAAAQVPAPRGPGRPPPAPSSLDG